MNGTVNKRLAVTAVFVALLAAAACGKSSVGSPVAPSGPSAPSQPSTTGATIRGQVNSSNLTVSVAGSSVSARVDNSGHFELDGAPAGNLDLQFVGQGVNARVSIGQVADHDQVQVQITLSGNNGSIDAVEHVAADDSARVEGVISSINSPGRSVQIGGASVQIPSGASIVSSTLQLSFADLKVGMRVEVEGAMQGNVVVAQRISVEDGSQAQPPEQEIQFVGAVSNLAGSCPGVAMTVAGKSVQASASTQFLNASCAALANGMTVEVSGNVTANGSVSASEIQVDDAGGSGGGSGGSGGSGGTTPPPPPNPGGTPPPPPPPDPGGGGSGGSGGSGGAGGGSLVTVAGFVPGFIPPSGTCPNIKFGVESKATGAYIDTFISADASTTYSGGTCGDVVLGTLLEVQGDLQPDKSLRAVVVKFTPKGAPVRAPR